MSGRIIGNNSAYVADGGFYGIEQGGQILLRNISLSEGRGATTTEAELRKRFAEELPGVEVQVSTVRQDGACRFLLCGCEQGHSVRSSGCEAGGEQFDVIGVAVCKGAAHDTQPILRPYFHEEAGRVVIGKFFVELLLCFRRCFCFMQKLLDHCWRIRTVGGNQTSNARERGEILPGGGDRAQSADKLNTHSMA